MTILEAISPTARELLKDESHVHEWHAITKFTNGWQDVCVTCGAHRVEFQNQAVTDRRYKQIVMNPEIPKDQTKRKNQIAILEAVIAKNAAAIEVTELCHKRQIEKQINRLAELRCQKILLEINEHPGRRSKH